MHYDTWVSNSNHPKHWARKDTRQLSEPIFGEPRQDSHWDEKLRLTKSSATMPSSINESLRFTWRQRGLQWHSILQPPVHINQILRWDFITASPLNCHQSCQEVEQSFSLLGFHAHDIGSNLCLSVQHRVKSRWIPEVGSSEAGDWILNGYYWPVARVYRVKRVTFTSNRPGGTGSWNTKSENCSGSPLWDV